MDLTELSSLQLQYIGKEPKEGSKDAGLPAKRKRKWAAILEAFNQGRDRPFDLKKLKDLRIRQIRQRQVAGDTARYNVIIFQMLSVLLVKFNYCTNVPRQIIPMRDIKY